MPNFMQLSNMVQFTLLYIKDEILGRKLASWKKNEKLDFLVGVLGVAGNKKGNR